MKIEDIKTVYRYNGIDLPVPPHISGDRDALRAFHATLYPEIMTAEIVDLGVSNRSYVIEYRRAVGTKG